MRRAVKVRRLLDAHPGDRIASPDRADRAARPLRLLGFRRHRHSCRRRRKRTSTSSSGTAAGARNRKAGPTTSASPTRFAPRANTTGAASSAGSRSKRATRVSTLSNSSSDLGDAHSVAQREHRRRSAPDADGARRRRSLPAPRAGVRRPDTPYVCPTRPRIARDVITTGLSVGDPSLDSVDHRRRHVASAHRRDDDAAPFLARRVEQTRIGAANTCRRCPPASASRSGVRTAGIARHQRDGRSPCRRRSRRAGRGPGLSNASSACVCVFVTSSAAKMRSDITTSTPSPRDCFTRRDADRTRRDSRDRPIRDRSTCASRR